MYSLIHTSRTGLRPLLNTGHPLSLHTHTHTHTTPLSTPCRPPPAICVFFFLPLSRAPCCQIASTDITHQARPSAPTIHAVWSTSSPPQGRFLRLEQRLFRHIGSIVQYLAVWNMQGNCIPTLLLHNFTYIWTKNGRTNIGPNREPFSPAQLCTWVFVFACLD